MVLVLFLATFAVWFAVEMYCYFTHKPLITTRVRDFYHLWPDIGVLAGIGTGLLFAHFFLQEDVGLAVIVGPAAGLAFGLIAGRLWFK